MLSPTRAPVDEGKRLLKTVAVQTPGTQKFTFVDPDNKLATAVAEGTPLGSSKEPHTQHKQNNLGGGVGGAVPGTSGGGGENKRSAQKVSASPNARAVPRAGVSTDREARSRTAATPRKSTDHLSASERKKAEEGTN